MTERLSKSMKFSCDTYSEINPADSFLLLFYPMDKISYQNRADAINKPFLLKVAGFMLKLEIIATKYRIDILKSY